MKKWNISLLLVLAGACATAKQLPDVPSSQTPTPQTVGDILAPTPGPVSLPSTPVKPLPQATTVQDIPRPRDWRTPNLVVHGTGLDTSAYTEAITLLKEHANSDAFMEHVRKKRTYFSHTTCKVVDCLRKFREQLDQADQIDVVFYTPFWPSRAIGGWDGARINQNTKYRLAPIERAGHLLHEISHKYGWTHLGNYTNRNDNINSLPYAIGNDLEEYLNQKRNLAGAKNP